MRSTQARFSSGVRWAAGFLVVLTSSLAGIATESLAEHAGLAERKAVDSSLASYSPAQNLSGRLTIAGSNTMGPMLKAMGIEFNAVYPDVKVAVEDVGSTAAITEFLVGFSSQRRGEKARAGHDGASEITILASSREMTEKEIATFRSRYGHDPIAIPVAMDGVAVYVNKDNPIQGMSMDQVDGVFSSTRNRGGQPIRKWGQLGLQSGWEKEEIRVYGRERASGTHDFFEHVALNGGRLRDDVIMKPGSASEIVAIARDKAAIGFAGIGFQGSFVRVVPLAARAGETFIFPSHETVVNKSYPMSRYLYLYVNQAPNRKAEPALVEFLKFVNSREGQQVVAKTGAYALPASVVAQNLNVLQGGMTTASIPSGTAVR